MPDTVFDIARCFGAFPKLNENYIIAHVNSRYMDSIEECAKSLDILASKLAAKIILLPIGPCHGDIDTAHQISALVQNNCEVENPESLKRFIQLISSATLYIGSSMHGFITACCYDTPSLLVLNKDTNMNKFNGLLSTIENDGSCILTNWNMAESCLDHKYVISKDVKKKIQDQLDRHWERVLYAIENGKRCRLPYYYNKWDDLVREYSRNSLVPRSLRLLVVKLRAYFVTE